MTGNNILFSRGLLNFDSTFDSKPEMQILKSALFQIFSIDFNNHVYKPFIDHTLSFSAVNNEVHFRHYEMIPTDKNAVQSAHLESLVEIGPRFSFRMSKVFLQNNHLIYFDKFALKSSETKNEINELKRKRKIKKNDNIRQHIENQRVTSDNPNRTLMISKVLN